MSNVFAMDDELKRRRHTQVLSLLMDLNLNERVHIALTDRNPKYLPARDMQRAFELMASSKTLDTNKGWLAFYIPLAMDVHMTPFLFSVNTSNIDDITTARDKTGGLKSFIVHFSGEGRLAVNIPESVVLELPGEKRKTHFFH